jgi:hypothetical protein
MPKRNRSKKNILKNISEASLKKIMQLKKKLLKGGMSDAEALKAAQNAYKKGGDGIVSEGQNDQAQSQSDQAQALAQAQSDEAEAKAQAQAQAQAQSDKAEGEISQGTPVENQAPPEEGYLAKLANSLKFWGGKNRGKSKNRRNRSKRNKKQTNKKRN